jgi:hypothetical protein
MLAAVLAWLAPSAALALDDFGRKVAVDAAGNIYVTGASESLNTGLDYLTIKYNPNGAVLWVRRYNGPASGDDKALALVLGRGTVFVTGGSLGAGTGEDFATICYNRAGLQIWVQRYNGPAGFTDEARAVGFLWSTNEVFVTGPSEGVNSGADYATIKYSLGGTPKWLARYDGPAHGDDNANALFVDPAGTVVVTGASDSTNLGADYTTVKYRASNGVQLWTARYNGTVNGADEALDIVIRPLTGDIYVTGASEGINSSTDIVTIKYATNGVLRWVNRYNGPGNLDDEGSAITLDLSGNICVTGFSSSTNFGHDYTTLKYSPAGVQLWAARYDGTAHGDDEAAGIAIDPLNRVIVTGAALMNFTGFDYTTIVYSPAGIAQRVLRYNNQ